MKEKLCIFAGTTEGRKLALLLHELYDLTLCVATEYGGILLDGIPDIRVRSGRMNEEEMEALLRGEGFDRVIDATHPYAAAVTENIRTAAGKAKVPLLRILRESEEAAGTVRYVNTAGEAAALLAESDGNILLTTGSKDLPAYASLDRERLWARVLPAAASLESCAEAGIAPSHIIAAQGPFTKEMNLALIRMIRADYLVTKDSGRNGGFSEKLDAAAEAGIRSIVIGKPPQTEGISFEEAVRLLAPDLSPARIFILGIGPGGEGLMSGEVKEALRRCDAVIGAQSVAEAVRTDKPVFYAFQPDRVLEIVKEHPSFRNIAVVMRGDTGFFSGAKKLKEALSPHPVTLLPGISSVSCLAARLGAEWDGAALLSLHGRDGALIPAVCKNRRTFVLTGGANSAGAVCRRLCEFGLGELPVAVGENLSLENERISRGTAAGFAAAGFAPLSVMMIENPEAGRAFRVGIPDEEFIRGDVPMTKAEVRAVSLSRLAPPDGAVIFDIGAGTGSVAVECALNDPGGDVFAVEKKAEAVSLIRQNRLKFRTENLHVIEGSAPGVLEGLPAPTHAFIGGSSGDLPEIVEKLLSMNPSVRIVINTVTLESFAAALSCRERFAFDVFDCVTVNITRSRPVGRYQMQTANNPVQIITLQRRHPDG